MILSASRRTDIPAYFSEWFIKRLQEGYVLFRNPLNHSQVSKIQLSPDIIDCIVFWTKDPVNMLDKLPMIDTMGFQYYFQFTLTPYGKDIERNLRDKSEIIQTFIQLSKSIGTHKVLWRYDPIILNDTITIDYHIEMFQNLCSQLGGYTKTCTISFVDIYSKLGRIVKNGQIRIITEAEMTKIALAFSKTAKEYGIELRACCESIDLSKYSIRSANCIDQSLIENICQCNINVKTDSNQRNGCGCIQSIDIGAYNTCKNNCIYCYANYSNKTVDKNCQNHNPCGDILIGSVNKEEKITERNLFSLKIKDNRTKPDFIKDKGLQNET